MINLADRHRKPISDVFNYPAWEIPYWQAYYSKEPSQGERIELAIARLCAIQTSTREKPTKPDQFMFIADWTPDIASDVDLLRRSLNKR